MLFAEAHNSITEDYVQQFDFFRTSFNLEKCSKQVVIIDISRSTVLCMAVFRVFKKVLREIFVFRVLMVLIGIVG